MTWSLFCVARAKSKSHKFEVSPPNHQNIMNLLSKSSTKHGRSLSKFDYYIRIKHRGFISIEPEALNQKINHTTWGKLWIMYD